MIGNKKNKTKKGGYVLLLTVVITSIILAMSLGLSNVSYKEQIFGIQAKESYLAFFSADTGLECALAHDRIETGVFSTLPDEVTIKCAGKSISAGKDPNGQEVVYDFELSQDEVNNNGVPVGNGCVHIVVTKNAILDDSTPTELGTIIEAKGYNLRCTAVATIIDTGSQNTRPMIERALRASYFSTTIADTDTGGGGGDPIDHDGSDPVDDSDLDGVGTDTDTSGGDGKDEDTDTGGGDHGTGDTVK